MGVRAIQMLTLFLHKPFSSTFSHVSWVRSYKKTASDQADRATAGQWMEADVGVMHTNGANGVRGSGMESSLAPDTLDRKNSVLVEKFNAHIMPQASITSAEVDKLYVCPRLLFRCTFSGFCMPAASFSLHFLGLQLGSLYWTPFFLLDQFTYWLPAIKLFGLGMTGSEVLGCE